LSDYAYTIFKKLLPFFINIEKKIVNKDLFIQKNNNDLEKIINLIEFLTEEENYN